MNIRTKIKSNGDLLVEQTTPERAGEFRVETQRDKLFFPLKVNGNNFAATTVQELYFANSIAEVSGSTIFVSYSGSLFSGTLDILQADLIALSESCAATDLILDSTIFALSSSVTSSFNYTNQIIQNLSASCESSDNLLSTSITNLSSSVSASFAQTLNNVSVGTPASGSHLIVSGGYWTQENFDTAVKNAAVHELWEDIVGTFDNSSGATSDMTLDQFDGSGYVRLHMRHDQNNFFCINFQMSHSWNLSTVKPHMHFIIAAEPGLNTTGTIDLGWQYAWTNPFSGITPWTTGSLSIPVSGSMYKQHFIIGIGDVSPPANPKYSSILLLRVMRSGSASSDTFTTSKPAASGSVAQANLTLLQCDTHYQKQRAGSFFDFHD